MELFALKALATVQQILKFCGHLLSFQICWFPSLAFSNQPPIGWTVARVKCTVNFSFACVFKASHVFFRRHGKDVHLMIKCVTRKRLRWKIVEMFRFGRFQLISDSFQACSFENIGKRHVWRKQRNFLNERHFFDDFYREMTQNV